MAAGGRQRMWRWDSRSIWRWEFARGRGTHIWRIGLGGFAFFLKKITLSFVFHTTPMQDIKSEIHVRDLFFYYAYLNFNVSVK